jgi:hypothetical protein
MTAPSLNLVDPDRDTNRFNPDVHYRLYDSERCGPIVVCVQDFDYIDYDGTRFLSYDAYPDESSAEIALRGLAVLLTRLANRFRETADVNAVDIELAQKGYRRAAAWSLVTSYQGMQLITVVEPAEGKKWGDL